MNKLLLFSFLCFFSIAVKAQDIKRHISFNPIDNDSLDMSLNSDYRLIEDSCATIIRHTRFNFQTRKFHGRFTDVRKDNPAVVLTEGNYNTDGLKDGAFTLRYSSGNIFAKGNFKDDKFDGRWELFYEDGKPELNFEAKDGVYTILDAWESKGTKTIDKGNGNYVIDLTIYFWKGKLVDGKPDGTWKMYSASDPYKQTINTEHFKKGEFLYGEGLLGKYTDASRMSLINSSVFKFINAEKMYIGNPCNMPDAVNRVVDAHFKSGNVSLKFHLQDALSAYMRTSNPQVGGSFYIIGDIDLTGHIVNLKKTGDYIANMEQAIIHIIEGMPPLIPATLDGKPVLQQFKVSLQVNGSGYSGSFQFLPIRYK